MLEACWEQVTIGARGSGLFSGSFLAASASSLVSTCWRFVFQHGKGEGEGRALACHRLDRDPPSVREHQLLGDVEAQPQSFPFAPLIACSLVKALKEVVQVVRFDPRPRVLHLEDRVLLHAAQPHVNALACSRVRQGIGEQVEQDLLQAPGICLDHQRRARWVELDGRAGRRQSDARDGLNDEGLQVDPFQMQGILAILEAGRIQQFFDQSAQSSALEEGRLGQFPRRKGAFWLGRETSEELLQAAEDDCQRATQFVAGQRHELVLQAMQAALGDVADYHDTPWVLVGDRLPCRLKVAPLAGGGSQGELQQEFLSARCALLWGRIGGQWLPFSIVGRKLRIGMPKEPRIGGIGEQRSPGPVHYEQRISHAAQDRLQPRPLVFCDEIGRYYTPRQVRTRFDTYVALPEAKQRKTNRGPKPMQERKPVLPEGTTFHQLRKTANTRLVERGVDPKTSAAIMGHGVSISLDIYTQVTPRMRQEAADVMDEDYG